MKTLNLILLLLLAPLISAQPSSYIVHMNLSAMPNSFDYPYQWYSSILRSMSSGHSTSRPRLLHFYTHVINGFSASLYPSHIYTLPNVPGFIHAYPDQAAALHTTYTPTFLSLTNVSGVWPASNYGDGTVVGVVDSGISPESPSFGDSGIGPVPSRWKGRCEVSGCNRKLVGARSFNAKFIAVDVNGHGTSRASVVAGNYVDGASFFGYAAGTAVGIAPHARVAAYNVVGDAGWAWASDVMAGVDAAIEDGVDVILIPMGLLNNVPLYEDPFAIAAYSANKVGIPVIFSAGNYGPDNYTVENGFPWAVTVGAGSFDRRFGGTLTLGNGLVIEGVSLFPLSLPAVAYTPLVYHKTLSACNQTMSLAGKIVVCINVGDIACQMRNVARSDVAGAIFISDSVIYKEMGAFPCPGIMITPAEAKALIDYVRVDADPRGKIQFQQTLLGASGRAPTLAAYSSRGPVHGDRLKNHLKPDLIAPGTRVLAAWPQTVPSATVGLNRNLSSTFAIRSGTSLASAHVAGVAALLKAAHPEWSPAAIRSAMMTTADPFDRHSGQPIRDDGKDYMTDEAATPFDMGSGHVDPNRALDPGLVYDSGADAYIGYLCGAGYTEQQISVITGWSENFTCAYAATGYAQLNQPAFVAIFPRKNSSEAAHLSQQFPRTVTNVGPGPAVYRPTVVQPVGYRVSVMPEKLEFRAMDGKIGFAVLIEGGEGEHEDGSVSFGSLAWISDEGKYVVRSPIAIIVEDGGVRPGVIRGLCRPELCSVNC